MSRQYLSDLYAYQDFGSIWPRPDDTRSQSREQQIRISLVNGARAMANRQNAVATADFLAAFALVPQVLYPSFPSGSVQFEDLASLGPSLIDPLVQASGQILRLRDGAAPDLPILAPTEPPDEVLHIAEKYNGRLAPGVLAYELALAHAQVGELSLARRFAANALRQARGADGLQGNARLLAGVVAILSGEPGEADEAFARATDSYQAAADPPGAAAVQHNLAVLAILAGKHQEAFGFLSAAADSGPFNVGWTISRSTLPGVASLALALEPPGLAVVVRSADGGWIKISTGGLRPPKRAVQLTRDTAPVVIDLERNPGLELTTRLLEPRRRARTLSALDCRLGDPLSFTAHLAHVYGFVLPLVLGNAYAALGDYDRAEMSYLRAREYPYLNAEIERPVVWKKLAQTLVDRGKSFFQQGDIGAARAAFDRVVSVPRPGAVALSGMLYSGVFGDQSFKKRAVAFLTDTDSTAAAALDYGSRILLLDAFSYQDRIASGVDHAGAVADEAVPTPWPVSTADARIFAGHLRRTELTARSVEAAMAQGTATGQTLSQAVTAVAVWRAVEQRRADAASARRQVAERCVALAELRLATTARLHTQLTALASVATELANANGWIGAERGPFNLRPFHMSRRDDHPHREALPVTTAGARTARDVEVARLAAQVETIAVAKAEAEHQIVLADRLAAAASHRRRLAELYLDLEHARRAHFAANPAVLHLWESLSRHSLDEAYRHCFEAALDSAIAARQSPKSGPDNGANAGEPIGATAGQPGFVASDLLLADVDRTAQLRMPEEQKRIALSMTISLAERSPYQFFRQLWESGRLDFETTLDDLERWYPGVWAATLRGVEVEIDSPDGALRPRGTLTNTGVSYLRNRLGATMVVIHDLETMYVPTSIAGQRDGLPSSSPGYNNVFAGIPVASGWVLAVESGGEAADPRTISDVRIVLHFDALCNPDLTRSQPPQESASTLNQHMVGFGLRSRFPQELVQFREHGTATFTIGRPLIHPHHADPAIVDLRMTAGLSGRTAKPALVATLSSEQGGVLLDWFVGADAPSGTGDQPGPFHALRGQPLLDRWTIRIDRERNAEAFAAGFRWDDVRDLYLSVDYAFKPLPTKCWWCWMGTCPDGEHSTTLTVSKPVALLTTAPTATRALGS